MKHPDCKEKIEFLVETDGLLRDYVHSIVINRIKTEIKDNTFNTVSNNQIQAAMILKRIAPCSLKQFAASLRLSKSAASAQAERMVENGIIKRELNPHNRREILLSLEPAFEKHMALVKKKLVVWFEELITEMGQDAFEKWHQVMLSLNTILQEKIKKKNENT